MTELVIKTSALTRSFGDVHAVRGVDLSVAAGEIYGFLGPNGAGKSTVVKMLITLAASDEWQRHRAGPRRGARVLRTIRLRIGAALQDASLDEKQSGREILAVAGCALRAELGARPMPASKSSVRLSRSKRSIGGSVRTRVACGVGSIWRLRSCTVLICFFSTSRRLVSIHRAVPKYGKRSARSINELGTTIFLTTQYLEEADELADRVGIINDGQIVGEGSPEELKRSIGADVMQISVDDADRAIPALEALPVVDHVDRGPRALLVSVTDGAAAVSPVVLALDDANVAVGELTLRTPTLDDVFLELTGDRIEVTQ